jgi:hypothetical protein
MRRELSLSLLFLAAGCDGPWNMEVGTSSGTLPRLSVSSLVVAGRGYDTIWLTRSLALTGTYDSTRTFVDTGRSWMRIIRTDGSPAPDTVDYHLAPPSAVAWIPGKASDLAVHGTHYRLEAHIVWDSAAAWGGNGTAQKEWKTTTLSATTYTPSTYALGQSFQAPIEALFSQLAGSGFSAFVADTANAGMKDSLARRNVTSATIDSLRQGIPVFRSVNSGDTVWYVRSADAVTGLDGTSSLRQQRAYLISQTVERAVFGGVLSLQRFDTTRARILDPVTLKLYASLGGTIDSASYYEAGSWRMTGFTEAYQSGLLYWPERMQLANLDIGYTGRNVFYAYSMDTLYALHLNGLSTSNTALPYTNISGGTGYFSGAAADSVSLYLMNPSADTISVSALHGAWCRDKRRTAAECSH